MLPREFKAPDHATHKVAPPNQDSRPERKAPQPQTAKVVARKREGRSNHHGFMDSPVGVP